MMKIIDFNIFGQLELCLKLGHSKLLHSGGKRKDNYHIHFKANSNLIICSLFFRACCLRLKNNFSLKKKLFFLIVFIKYHSVAYSVLC